MPETLFAILLPVALGLAVISVTAVSRRSGPTVFAHTVLAAFFVLGVVYAGANAGDWMHLLWSVKFALLGLFLGAGIMLARVWADDRRRAPGLLGRRSGATVALAGIAVIGTLPAVLLALGAEPTPAGRVDGSPLPALVEVALYGFGGPVPELMIPEHAAQLERGLGSPPRFVTVPMGTTLLAAVLVIVFCLLAFLGRVLPVGRARRAVFAVAPVAVGLTLVAVTGYEGLEGALWSNEPWLVRAYGPVLLAAFILALSLLVAVRIDGLRCAPVTHQDGPRPLSGPSVSNRVIATH